MTSCWIEISLNHKKENHFDVEVHAQHGHLIYAIKNQPAEVKHAFEHHYGQFCISAVTAMELVFGAEKSSNVERNLNVIEGFMARLDVLEYDKAAAIQTAQIKAELARCGTPIGSYDVMLAGHARSHGLIMVTNNLREFSRVSGLRSESWVDKPTSV